MGTRPGFVLYGLAHRPVWRWRSWPPARWCICGIKWPCPDRNATVRDIAPPPPPAWANEPTTTLPNLAPLLTPAGLARSINGRHFRR